MDNVLVRFRRDVGCGLDDVQAAKIFRRGGKKDDVDVKIWLVRKVYIWQDMNGPNKGEESHGKQCCCQVGWNVVFPQHPAQKFVPSDCWETVGPKDIDIDGLADSDMGNIVKIQYMIVAKLVSKVDHSMACGEGKVESLLENEDIIVEGGSTQCGCNKVIKHLVINNTTVTTS